MKRNSVGVCRISCQDVECESSETAADDDTQGKYPGGTVAGFLVGGKPAVCYKAGSDTFEKVLELFSQVSIKIEKHGAPLLTVTCICFLKMK